MHTHPDSPDPGAAKAKAKCRDDIAAFREAVQDADVVTVGPDHDYLPDSPRLRADHPNAGGDR